MLNCVTANRALKFFLLVVVFSNLSFATTVTLNWGTVNWTGSNSQNLNIDPSNPGGDVTVSITPSSGATATATVGANPLTGVQNNLAITVSGSDTAYVTVKFDFHYQSVSNVSLRTSGVDLPTDAVAPTEITNLFGKSGSSYVAGSFAVPAASTAVYVQGSGLSSTLLGQSMAYGNQSNATINMLSSISAFQFVFGTPNGGSSGPETLYLGQLVYIAGNPLTSGDPGGGGGGITLQQGVDPEPTTVILFASGLAAIAIARYRRKKTTA